MSTDLAYARSPRARGSAAPLLLLLFALLVLLVGLYLLFGKAPGGDGDGSRSGAASASVSEPGEPATSAVESGRERREQPADGATLDEPPPANGADAEAEPEGPPTGFRGRVIGADGEPASGATVFATRSVGAADAERFTIDVPPAGKPGRFERRATTGEDGEFIIPELIPAGGYEVWVEAEPAQVGIASNLECHDGVLIDVGDVGLRVGAMVSGWVRTAAGAPVAGAEVSMGSSRTRAAAVTDAAGRFDAGVIMPGRTRVRVRADGFAPAALTDREFLEGDRIDDLELVMVAAAPIRGRVLDVAGRPVAGVTVHASRTTEGDRGFFGEVPNDSMKSDAEGRFLFTSLPLGQYQLVAFGDGYQSERDQIEAGGPEVELRVTRFASASGRVIDADNGRPLAGADVTLLWQAPWLGDGEFMPHFDQIETTTDSLGSFRRPIPRKGTYCLEAVAPGYRAGRSTAFEVDEGQDLTGLLISVEPAEGLEVHVTRRVDGAPMARALVRVEPHQDIDGSSHAIFTNVMIRGRRSRPTVTDESGTAHVGALSPGRYVVRVRCDGFAEGRSEPFDVSASGAVAPITVTLGEGGAVAGVVRNQFGEVEPARKVNARDAENGVHSAISRADGSYRIEHLPPGRYAVACGEEDEGPQAELRRLGYLGDGARDDAEAYPVVVTEGATSTHDVEFDKVIPGSLVGTVRIDGGVPTGVTVTLGRIDESNASGPSGRGNFMWGISNQSSVDEDGGFRFRRVDPGRYRITVFKRLGTTYDGGEAQIHPRVESRVSIDIATGRISGAVVGAEGAPLAGARVVVSPAGGGDAMTMFGGSSAMTDEHGRFVIDELASADYEVRVSHRGHHDETRSVRVPPRGDGGPLRVQMKAGGWIKVLVDDAAGESSFYVAHLIDESGATVEQTWVRKESDGAYWLRAKGFTAGTVVLSRDQRDGSAPVRVPEGENIEVAVTIGG